MDQAPGPLSGERQNQLRIGVITVLVKQIANCLDKCGIESSKLKRYTSSFIKFLEEVGIVDNDEPVPETEQSFRQLIVKARQWIESNAFKKYPSDVHGSAKLEKILCSVDIDGNVEAALSLASLSQLRDRVRSHVYRKLNSDDPEKSNPTLVEEETNRIIGLIDNLVSEDGPQ